uniref:Uncharacterized protein n=1 Tax=Arion vulgaris TaxID=1028688 RepID=A0A0B7BEV0_9EUPU
MNMHKLTPVFIVFFVCSSAMISGIVMAPNILTDFVHDSLLSTSPVSLAFTSNFRGTDNLDLQVKDQSNKQLQKQIKSKLLEWTFFVSALCVLANNKE